MRHRIFPLLLALLLVLAIFSPIAGAVSPDDWNSETPENLQEGHLYSQTAVMIDAQSGEILFDKDSKVRMYPASTTKIMVLLLALESGKSMDEIVTIPREANDVPSDSSFVPVLPGEEMTWQDLLMGFMINSGNDAGNAIAVLVSGSIDAFVTRMNQRADELGCKGTHFANAHGYHDENHYSTAYDMALIAQEAMRNEEFRKIVSTTEYTMAATSRRAELKLTTHNILANPASEYYYEGCIGIKTGVHSKAGNCFVGAATRNGVTLITVTMNASNSNRRFLDNIRLFDYGFTCYDLYSLSELFDLSGQDVHTTEISNAAKDDPQKGLLGLRLTQVSDPDFARYIPKEGEARIKALADFAARTSVNLREGLAAPITEGEIVGTVSYVGAEGDEVTAMLAAQRSMEAQPETMTLYDILPFLEPIRPFLESGAFVYVILAVIVIVIALIFLRVRHAAKRHRRRQEIYDLKRREYHRQQVEKRRREAALRARREGNARVPARRPPSAPAKSPRPGNNSTSAARRPAQNAKRPQNRRPGGRNIRYD